MKKIVAVVVVLVAALFVANKYKLNILNAMVQTNDLTISQAVSFGPSERLKLNVYKPNAGGDALQPVVVFFYGGSWKRGQRDDYLFAAERLTEIGYTVVVPDYRLYPEVKFPDFVDDGALAVKWTADNIQSYGGDPDKIFLMGHSAGAHIAALLGLDEGYLQQVGLNKSQIKGVVGLAGPYAFYPSKTASIAAIFADLPDENTARPITFVDGAEPPFLLLHGDADTVVYPENTDKLSAAIKAAGGTAHTIVYPEVSHAGIVLGLSLSPVRPEDPILADIKIFLDAQVASVQVSSAQMSDASGLKSEPRQALNR